MYLAVSNSAVSSTLIREELGAQHPVFYESKAFLDAETRYPKLEKLILALLVNKKKESSKADGTFAELSQPRDMGRHHHPGWNPVGTNYHAWLPGMRLAKELAIKRLTIYSDSQLITNQALGEYMAKHPRMILYLDKHTMRHDSTEYVKKCDCCQRYKPILNLPAEKQYMAIHAMGH
ncbi:unnamed protein product [Prunus brigantina]